MLLKSDSLVDLNSEEMSFDRVVLDDDQRHLLCDMVEAFRSVSKERFWLSASHDGTEINHSGLSGGEREVYDGDISVLVNTGLLERSIERRGTQWFDISPDGFKYYEYLKRGVGKRESVFSEEVTGWEKVDRALAKVKLQLEASTDEEDYQQVGLLCREVLISLAQSVYDPTKHAPTDGVLPSQTDAKRMIGAFISSELSGGSNEEARKHARASLDLANALQHRRTATFRDAALCAEASVSVVNIAAIVVGLRRPV